MLLPSAVVKTAIVEHAACAQGRASRPRVQCILLLLHIDVGARTLESRLGACALPRPIKEVTTAKERFLLIVLRKSLAQMHSTMLFEAICVLFELHFCLFNLLR